MPFKFNNLLLMLSTQTPPFFDLIRIVLFNIVEHFNVYKYKDYVKALLAHTNLHILSNSYLKTILVFSRIRE